MHSGGHSRFEPNLEGWTDYQSQAKTTQTQEERENEKVESSDSIFNGLYC